MSKFTSGWKKNIPLEDFVVGGEHNVPLERTLKADKPPTRTAAIVKMTMAGVPTANAAIYLPDEMWMGVRSWTTPYERPIQVHHNDLADPIGRVKDARYVDTSREAVDKYPKLAQAMSVFHNSKSSLLNRLRTVAIFQEADAAIDDFQGVGRIDGLWDVSDPEAVQKIIDKRYLTVSTSFTPKGAHCSQCAREGVVTDWRRDECDHERGEYYDGYKCLAIPFGFNYDEVSPVNSPAAKHATIVEVGENLSFSDSVANSSVLKRPSIDIIDFIAVNEDYSVRFSDNKTCKFPTSFKDFYSESKSENQSNVIETNIQGKPKDSKMKFKLSRLFKDAALLNEEVSKLLPEGYSKMSDEDAAKLDESSFIGPNRTLMVVDLVQADAVKALLDDCEDSELKTITLESLDSKRVALTPKEEDSAPATEVETPAEQGESDSAPVAESEPEADLSEKVSELTQKLKDSQERLEEVELEKTLLKKRLDDMQKDYRAQITLNEGITKKLRDNLVDRLLDAKASRGVKFSDRKAEFSKYQDRSLSSIEDSIKEISDVPTPTPGMSGVAVVKESSPSEKDSDNSVDVSRYSDIYSKFLDVKYSRGDSAAELFLNEQKRQGFLPASVRF